MFVGRWLGEKGRTRAAVYAGRCPAGVVACMLTLHSDGYADNACGGRRREAVLFNPWMSMVQLRFTVELDGFILRSIFEGWRLPSMLTNEVRAG